MESNKAYITALSVGSTFTYGVVNAEYTQGAKTIIYPLGEVSKVRLTGTGGSSPRLWCFVDANDVVISVASENAVANGLEIQVPANAAKLISTFTASSSSMKIEVFR